MTKSLFYALLVLVCVIFTCSAQSNSCIGRCGEDYYRGYLCHCDYDCLTHNECCKDYEAKCTTRGSCKGRCGESFKRGRQCDCDSDCAKFGQCCPDYKQFCAAEVNATEASKKPSNSAIEGPNPCLNTHASTPAADPPMPEDSEAQSEGEDVNEVISDSGLSPTDPPYYEEQPASPPPEDAPVINDIPEEAPVPEGSSGYEPLATSFPPAPIPTSAMTMPMTDMPGDAEAGLEADLEGEGLSLDGPTLHAVSDWSPAPASQVPTTVNPDSTPPPSNPSDPISTTSTPASEEQASTTMQTSAATEPTVKPTSEDPNPANSTPSVAGEPIVPLEEEANTAPADSLDLKAAPTVASTTPVEEANTPTPDDQEKPVENAASTEQPSALDNLANLGPAGTQEATESTAIPAVKPTEAHTASTIKPPTAGADGATAPTDQVQDSQPDSSDSQSPIAEPSDPEATVKPLEMTAMPGETTPEPVEKTTKSVETTAKPTEKTPNLLDTMAKPVEKTTKAPKVTPLPSKPTKKPEKPSSPNDIEFPGMDTSRDYQSDDSNDTNLCSGRPINGLTTLKNGTTVVFRGHYFWMLDALKTPGPAQGITETWGIPSPIDTVFTRCNCQGKTYFLKGRYYWRFENDVMDPGYPKAISRGFDGLSGHITAALSVPAYLRRRESVYFFKRGGRVQKYSYDPSKAPKCSGSQPSQRVHYTVFSRRTRQAETYLGKELSIADAWKSFPATVTSAVSIPSRQTVDGYKYFVFTRTRHYNIRIDEERPTVTTPARSAQTQSFFNCPKKSQE